MNHKLTVGMEIHVQLQTKTKMFCGCLNDPFHSQPNTNVCPVCYGLPGTLPMLNREAIKQTVKLGQALNGQIADTTFWARKNYFYPDLPKGYQISQSTAPVVGKASLTIDGQTHRIQRIHLEEDAGKLTHQADKTMIDYNRAGVPLLELVTEPDFHSAQAAKSFCQELQRIIRHLDLSQADMEKGQMRCEANISVSPSEDELGTKVEVKNINSFRSVERAIDHEFERQKSLLESGQLVVAETRSWNDSQNKTLSMRTKETSADYRYFPEPDLPKVKLSSSQSTGLQILPDAQRQQLVHLGLSMEIARTIVDRHLFDQLIELVGSSQENAIEASKLYLAQSGFGQLKTKDKLDLMRLRQDNGWTNETIKTIIDETLEDGQPLAKVAEKFTVELDLAKLASQAIEDHPSAVEDYKKGRLNALNFLIGQVIAKSEGKANFKTVKEILEPLLR